MAWDPALWALSLLGVPAFLAALAAARAARRFRKRVLEARVWDRTAFLPKLLVLVPVAGVDLRLEGNLDSILAQRYPSYRVVVCADSRDDPAVAAAERAASRRSVKCDIAVARPAPGFGGKALALLAGLMMIRKEDEAVAFLDADIRPPPRFLRDLVQPLAHPEVGGTTGYRWYVPVRRGFWSTVRSAWNAAGLNVFFDDRYNFLWGGAWAIRRETLDRLDPEALWRGTLSEDLAVTRAVKSMGLRVQFVPQAVAPTYEDADRRGCVEWTTRQTAMVALWGRTLRNFAALAYGVFNGSVLLGLLALGLALSDPRFLLPVALFLADVPVGILNGEHRRRSVFLGSPHLREPWRVPAATWAAASLLVPWLIAWNLIRTRRVTSIEWRGKRYRVGPGSVELEVQRK